MLEKNKEYPEVIVSNTLGLTSILQLIDTTMNNTFIVEDRTSDLQLMQITIPPKKQEKKSQK